MASTQRKRSPNRPPLLRRALRAAVWFGLGCIIGLAGPWIWWLDREAGKRFSERQWTLSSRVYARPLEVYAGLALSATDLELELTAAGLAQGDPSVPGRYRRSGPGFDIHVPGFVFPDGRQSARRLAVEFESDRVARLSAADNRDLSLARLPPAEIGSLVPSDDRDRTLVALIDFPTLLVAGIQAVEDRQFKRHFGIDPKGMLRAAWRNLRHGEVVQGGSTITQQLVKNLYLDSRRSLVRKFNEAIMAFSIERRFSKAEILETYLNEVWLGQVGGRAIHGFGRASEHYFGVPVQVLAPEQIALLIGMARGASWYHPGRNPERALARRNLVLDMFAETGLLTPEQYEQAREAPLGVDLADTFRTAGFPAFMDLIRRELNTDYRERDLRETGMRIFTTLSPSAQHHAEQAVAKGLSNVEATTGASDLQAAVVLVEPASGEVRALVGDRIPRRAGFNRALDARRQVGSAIKPFVYLLALAHQDRFNLVTPLDDVPISVPLRGQPSWQPKNYDGQSHGQVPLMTALAQSYNQATVQLGMQVGVPPLLRLMAQLGVDSGADPNPSVLLGAVDLAPLEVAQLYQPLAADGFAVPLRAITAVVDAAGQAINSYPLELRPIRERQALSLVSYALEEAVANGTGRSLSGRLNKSLPVAGKTGTTNDLKDAWFAGYTPDWLGIVWVGRDDNRPAGITGATGALPVWAELFRELPVAGHRRTWPEGIEWFWIDWPQPWLAEQACNGARAMPFIAGSQPRDYSPCMRTRARQDLRQEPEEPPPRRRRWPFRR